MITTYTCQERGGRTLTAYQIIEGDTAFKLRYRCVYSKTVVEGYDVTVMLNLRDYYSSNTYEFKGIWLGGGWVEVIINEVLPRSTYKGQVTLSFSNLAGKTVKLRFPRIVIKVLKEVA